MNYLHHCRAQAQLELARSAGDTSFTALRPATLSEYDPFEYWEPIVVPELPHAAHTELKRGKDPVATFRRWVRRLEIAAAYEVVKARQAFALSKSAIAWLPLQAPRF